MRENILDLEVLGSLNEEELKRVVLSANDEELDMLYFILSLYKKIELYEKVSSIILEDEVCKFEKALSMGFEYEYMSYLNIWGKIRLFVFLVKKNNVQDENDFIGKTSNDCILLQLLFKEIKKKTSIKEFRDMKIYLDDNEYLYH